MNILISASWDQQLISTQLLDETEAHSQTSEQAVTALKEERDALKAEVEKLQNELLKLQKSSPVRMKTEHMATKQVSKQASKHNSTSSSSTKSDVST